MKANDGELTLRLNLSAIGIILCIGFFVMGFGVGWTLSVYDLLLIGFFISLFISSLVERRRLRTCKADN